jgi:hypothetical protein
MLDKIFGRLLTRQAARAKSEAERWQALVASAAADKLDEKEAEAVLAATGKKVEDLQAGVERLRERQGWAAILAKAKTVPADRERIHAALAAAQAALEGKIAAAEEQHSATIGPLRQQQQQAELLYKQGEDAQRLLEETYLESPEDQAERARLEAALADKKGQEAGHRQQAEKIGKRRADAAAELLPSGHRSAAFGERRAELVESLPAQEAEVNRHLAAAAALQQEMAVLQQEMAALDARALNP